jgi:hypothetical protein
MEEAPENGKELSHSPHANGMNEYYNSDVCSMIRSVKVLGKPVCKILKAH